MTLIIDQQFKLDPIAIRDHDLELNNIMEFIDYVENQDLVENLLQQGQDDTHSC